MNPARVSFLFKWTPRQKSPPLQPHLLPLTPPSVVSRILRILSSRFSLSRARKESPAMQHQPQVALAPAADLARALCLLRLLHPGVLCCAFIYVRHLCLHIQVPAALCSPANSTNGVTFSVSTFASSRNIARCLHSFHSFFSCVSFHSCVSDLSGSSKSIRKYVASRAKCWCALERSELGSNLSARPRCAVSLVVFRGSLSDSFQSLCRCCVPICCVSLLSFVRGQIVESKGGCIFSNCLEWSVATLTFDLGVLFSGLLFLSSS